MFRFIASAALPIALTAWSSQAAAATSFRNEVAPLLQRRCGTCHDAEQAKGRYRMDTFERLMKPGESDLAPVTPGKPKDSELYNLLLEHSPEDRMPQKADPLPEAEIALLERWISEGAVCDGSSPQQPLVEMVRESMLHDAPQRYARPVPATTVAFSPDGHQLAVSGYYEVTIWNVSDGILLSRIGRLPERITSIAWHPHLPLLAVAGGSPNQWGTVALADPTNIASPRYLCDLPEVALSVAFSPDGTRMAAGCGDRTVRLYNPVTGRERKVLKLHADWVQTVAFSPDGERLLSASRDRTARVINPATFEVLASYTAHETPLLAAAFSADNSRAWSLARGGIIQRWDASNGEKKGEFKGADFISLLPVGNAMITTATDRKLRVYEDDKQKATWDGPSDYPQCVAASPDGRTIAIGGSDGVVTLLEATDGKTVGHFIVQPR